MRTYRKTPLDKLHYLQAHPYQMNYQQMSEYLGKTVPRCWKLAKLYNLQIINQRPNKVKNDEANGALILRMFRRVRYTVIADMIGVSRQTVTNFVGSQGLAKHPKKRKPKAA